MLTLYDLADTYCHDNTTIIIGNAGKYGTGAVLSDPEKIPPEMWDLQIKQWSVVVRPTLDVRMEDILIVATAATEAEDIPPFC